MMDKRLANCILLVDDDFINREVMKNIFAAHYNFIEAENGLEGLRKINEHEDELCAILLDVSMPVMDGMELLKALDVCGIPERIPVFLITASEEAEVAREAYELGVMDVITKPVTPYVTLKRVRSIIELFEARKALSAQVEDQSKKLEDTVEAIDALHRNNIVALSSAIEFRDVESGEHTNRIYGITKHILSKTEMGAGFTPVEIENMAVGAIMHDVGKIAISDVILNKPGRLSREEFDIMKTHTIKGEMLMKSIAKMQTHEAYGYACDIARHHHERWDGRGYPDGLKGDEITVWSQVVSIADVYDALISPRVYKKAFTPDQAVEMIKDGECGVFNPKLLRCFFQVEPEIRTWYKQQPEEPRGEAPAEMVPSPGEATQPTREVMDVLLLMAAVKNAYHMIICSNLTKNSYYMIDYDRFKTHCAGYDGVFDDLITYGASSVPERARQSFIDAFNRQHLLQVYAKGTHSVKLEHPQVADDGSVHQVETTVLLMEDARTGDVLNITLARYIDAEMAERERNRQVLADALAVAEQANSAKTDFLSRMSHDIRTPLNAIIGMSTIIAANIDDREKIADCLVKISTSSKFLLGLINDILDFSKIESGRMALNESHFDLRNTVAEIEQIVDVRAAEKNQTFAVSVADSVLHGYIGDEFRVRQILMNLLDNARKYTHEGGHFDLQVDVAKQMGKKQVLRFIVEDNGIGIRKEFLENLFDPFAQDESDSKHDGVGLGLAITRNLVYLMNGEMSVETEKNRGTCFTIEIPLEPAEMTPPVSCDLNVLVVDDEAAVCEHTALLLGKMGISASVAQSGYKAVEMIERRLTDAPFDVVIVDWRMPGMDGIETVRRIRKLVGKHVLVVVMSAYDWSEIEDEARSAGVDLFLAKPILEYNLRATLACSEKLLQENIERDFNGERLLVAEDNELNQEVVKTILEMKNLRVDVVPNGKEAVARFEASDPGEYLAILMDVVMPVMGGHDATRAIRASKHPDGASVPIYAMTANAFHDDVVEAEMAGMNGHFAKPIDFDEVTRILQRVRAAKT